MFQFLAITQAGCRRSFPRHLLHRITTLAISTVVVLVAQVIYTQPVNADQASRPNIVLIMADDMGYSDLGCYGGEIRTPHLDELAANGLRFTNFYSENMCWVSRAAMLTGVYHKTSMVDSAIHPGCPTMAESLLTHNYQTRMSGKWHLAGKRYKTFPADRGFEEFYGILGGAASFFAPAHLTRNRRNIEEEAKNSPKYYVTHAISDEAEHMILSTDAEKPVFIYVAYTAAHWPLHALDEDIEAYDGAYSMGWDELRKQRLANMKKLGIVPSDISLSPRHPKISAWSDENHPKWQQRRMEVYAAQVTAMDKGIGKIVAALEKSGRLENTLILFTIDNGGCHVEYTEDRKGDYLPSTTRDGRPVRPGNLPSIMPGPEDTYQSYGYGWANASNTPYRLFKQFDHEGGIRTPMIAHWPQGIAAKGKLVRSVAHLVDIAPTIYQVTDTERGTPQDGWAIPLDGISLAPAFQGDSLPKERTLFFHHAKGRALRHGSWKIVAEGKGPWELYNLAKDPLELSDLRKTMPDKLDELTAIWDRESKRLTRQAKVK